MDGGANTGVLTFIPKERDAMDATQWKLTESLMEKALASHDKAMPTATNVDLTDADGNALKDDKLREYVLGPEGPLHQLSAPAAEEDLPADCSADCPNTQSDVPRARTPSPISWRLPLTQTPAA